jgi:integrase
MADRGSRLKRSTRERYVHTLAHHILPPLGALRLEALSRRDVEAWCADVEDLKQPSGKPYARDTIEGWWRVLTAVLRDACAEFGLPDPTVRVRPPQVDTEPVREQGTYSHEEVGRLLRTLREHWPQWYEEAYICTFTGARAGELYAVTWPQVSFERAVIEIDRAHWRGEVGSPKTRKGKRTVPLTKRMVGMLRARRARMVREQAPGLEEGLVFPNVHGGMRLPNALYTVLVEASALAELPFKCTPQVLRRTFNTRLLEAGVDRVVIRSMMGHTSEQMTERYAGVRVELKREAALVLERACEVGPEEQE